jgi:hypothetical protein
MWCHRKGTQPQGLAAMLCEETFIIPALGYVLFSILYLGCCLQFDKDFFVVANITTIVLCARTCRRETEKRNNRPRH